MQVNMCSEQMNKDTHFKYTDKKLKAVLWWNEQKFNVMFGNHGGHIHLSLSGTIWLISTQYDKAEQLKS